MSDALPLPPRPNLEQYKKLAKDFQNACKSSDSDAIRQWAARWLETLARLHGPSRLAVRAEIASATQNRSTAAGTSFKKTHEHAGQMHAGRRAVLHRARTRIHKLAEVFPPRPGTGPRQFAGLGIRSRG